MGPELSPVSQDVHGVVSGTAECCTAGVKLGKVTAGLGLQCPETALSPGPRSAALPVPQPCAPASPASCPGASWDEGVSCAGEQIHHKLHMHTRSGVSLVSLSLYPRVLLFQTLAFLMSFSMPCALNFETCNAARAPHLLALSKEVM